MQDPSKDVQAPLLSPRKINRNRRSLCGWIEIYDEKRKRFYYHDPKTNKVSWLHPKDMGIFPSSDNPESSKDQGVEGKKVDEVKQVVKDVVPKENSPAKMEEIVQQEQKLEIVTRVKPVAPIAQMKLKFEVSDKVDEVKEEKKTKAPIVANLPKINFAQLNKSPLPEEKVEEKVEEKPDVQKLKSGFSLMNLLGKKKDEGVSPRFAVGSAHNLPKTDSVGKMQSPRLGEKSNPSTPRSHETGVAEVVEKGEEDYQRKFDHYIDDLILLKDPTNEGITQLLQKRYKDGNFYTYVGPQLVSVNPYADKKLYTNEVKHIYHQANPYEKMPHVYSIGEMAFRSMKETGKPQSIIISGESGAGKTVACRLIVEYLAAISISGLGTDSILKIMTNSNPILEAFGNAKTLKNDNSSRFGKNTELFFNFKGQLVGGHITTSLLEKSRVCYQRPKERNFHIFYQLCSGADDDLKLGLGLTSPKHYQYLNQNEITVDGINDAEMFKQTQRALSDAGISMIEQMEIYKIVAAILHIGNLKFVKNPNDKTEKAVILTTDVLKMAAKNLSVTEDALERAILNRNIKVAFNGKNEISEMAQNEVQAVKNRDALAKDIFERLFLWLIGRINQSSKRPEDAKLSIGILDISGFEIYKENSFEQLNINYFNERIQQLVQKWLVKELEEYVKEGVAAPNEFIDVKSSNECVELISGQPFSVYSYLDEESLLRGGGSDKNFIGKLISQFDREKWKGVFTKDRFDPLIWHCAHYAAKVPYTVTGWIEKNNDTVYEDLIKMMQKTNSNLVGLLYPKSERIAESKLQSTAVYQFQQDVTRLVDLVRGRDQHYIRCIKPNHEQKPDAFQGGLVEEQVMYLGITENVQIKKSGYFSKMTYDQFLKRYKLCSNSTWPRWRGKVARDGVAKILKDMDVTTQAAFGDTKVFLKTPFVISILDEKVEERKDDMARIIQLAYRDFKDRKKRKMDKDLLKQIEKKYNDKSKLLAKWELSLVDENGDRQRVMLVLTEKAAYVLDSSDYAVKRRMQYENMDELFCSNLTDGVFGVRMTEDTDVLLDSIEKHDVMDSIMSAYNVHFGGKKELSKNVGNFFTYRPKTGVTLELNYKPTTQKKTVVSHSETGITVEVKQQVDVFEGKKIRRRNSFNKQYWGDYLKIEQSQLFETLKEKNGDRFVAFSSALTKYNKKYKAQERVLVVTDKHLYYLEPNGYMVNGTVVLSKLKGISVSPFTDGFVIIHCDKGDYVFETNKKSELLKVLQERYAAYSKRTLKMNVKFVVKNNKKDGTVEDITFQEEKDILRTWLEPVKGGALVHVKPEEVMNLNLTSDLLQDIYMGQKLRRRNSIVRWYLGDYLHIQNSKFFEKFRNAGDNKILFSGVVSKVNKHGQVQSRKLVITDGAIYNIDGDSYDIKRKIPIEKLDGVYLSTMRDGFFVVKVAGEYDYLFMSPEKTEIVKVLMDGYKIKTGKDLSLHVDNTILYHPEKKTVGGNATIEFKENPKILAPTIFPSKTGMEIQVNNEDKVRESAQNFSAGIQDRPDSVYSGRKYRRRASIGRVYVGDYMRLEANPIIKGIMAKFGDSQLIFSAEVNKINKKGVAQKRILIITDKHLYNVDPNGMKVKRQMKLTDIEGVSVSSLTDGHFCIHNPNTYDYLYESDKKTEIMDTLAECLKHEGKLLKVNVGDHFEYQPEHGLSKEINFVVDGNVTDSFFENEGNGLTVHVNHQEPAIILESAMVLVKDQPKPIEVGPTPIELKLRKRWKYKLEIRFYCNQDMENCLFVERVTTVSSMQEFVSKVGKLVKRDERYVITLPERLVLFSIFSKTRVKAKLCDEKGNPLLAVRFIYDVK